MAIVSVDVGNGFVKAFAVEENDGFKIRKNSKGEPVDHLIFKTISIPDPRKIRYNPNKNNIPGDYEITLDNKNYLVGNQAFIHEGQREWGNGRTHVVSDSYIYCVTAAMDMFEEPEGGTLDVTLLLGLPYNIYHDYYRQDGENDSELYKSVHGKSFHVVYGEKDMIVKFSDVRIYAQGSGAYYSNILRVDGEGKSEEAMAMVDSVMIDVGYKTTDVVVYTLNEDLMAIEPLEEYCFTIDLGMRNVVSRIPQYLEDRTGVVYNREVIDDGIFKGKNSVRLGRDAVPFDEKLEEESEKLAQGIYNELTRRADYVIKTWPYIMLSGGGSTHVYPYLKKKIRLLEIVEGDPTFANAIGYVSWYEFESKVAARKEAARKEKASRKAEPAEKAE